LCRSTLYYKIKIGGRQGCARMVLDLQLTV